MKRLAIVIVAILVATSAAAHPKDIGGFSLQGGRSTQEDRWVVGTNVVAVFDGHNGAGCADFMSRYLTASLEKITLNTAVFIDRVIQNTFLVTDNIFRLQLPASAPRSGCRGGSTDNSGTTATAFLFFDNTFYVAHVGDSRAVVVGKNGAVWQTRDHTAADGELDVSHALGDFRFKQGDISQHIVKSTPDISYFTETGVAMAILATDGLWDVFSNEKVISFVHRQQALGQSACAIAEGLARAALEESSRDNITVVVMLYES